ncbi:MAG: hypothetical protein WKF59_21480 [Chitinophagaceae bacterium]
MNITGSKYVAKVWKNGVATSLTNGSADEFASSVYVSGTDVYVAGYESDVSGFGIDVAKVWKNGVATSLTNGLLMMPMPIQSMFREQMFM